MVIYKYTFDEQERHPALLREPDMMDTPPIQMLIKRLNDDIVLFLADYGIISYEVVPLFLLNREFVDTKK